MVFLLLMFVSPINRVLNSETSFHLLRKSYWILVPLCKNWFLVAGFHFHATLLSFAVKLY